MTKPTTSAAAPVPASKIAHVICLLERPEGATLNDVVAVTGWLPHTTRAALTGLRKKGYEISRTAVDKVTHYTIVGRSERDAR